MNRGRNRGGNKGSGKNSPAKEPIRVFCRLRPLDDKEAPTCVQVVSRMIVQLSPPESAVSLRNGVPQRDIQYIFRHVFDAPTSQKRVFDMVALPLVEDVLLGKNGLLFTYGVTGSGKTFTMTGTNSEGGIMPRCLDVIFNTIEGRQVPKYTFKPDKLNGFDVQSDVDALADRHAEFTAGLTQASRAGSRTKLNMKKEMDPILVGRQVDLTKAKCNNDCVYGVFVTYIEIYNNSVYDLLEDCGDENKPIRQLQAKIVREDSTHNMFVHGVTEIEVASTEEAFEAFYRGQKRKRMAYTSLNTESSRSHSVFTIRLVQAPAGFDHEDLMNSKKVLGISQLSLVDLAGSERSNRTRNTGQRLREAGNINNSLMTLRTCLELLRENQNGANKMIPYRDSRLTHLFKNYFEGEGQVSMIVCISPHVDEYDENIHVLKFAEMSQEVQVTCPTPYKGYNFATPSSKRAQMQIYKHRLELGSDSSEGDTASKKVKLQTAPRLRLFNDFPSIKVTGLNDTETIPNLRRYTEVNLELYLESMKTLQSKQERLLDMVTKSERNLGIVTSEKQALKNFLEKEKEKVSVLEVKVANSETQLNVVKRKLEDYEENVKRLKTELASKEQLLTKKKLEGEKVREHYSSKIIHAQEKMKTDMERKLRSQKTALEMEMRSKDNKLKEVKRILSSNDVCATPVSTASSYGSSNLRSEVATPTVINSAVGPGVAQSARRMGVPVCNRRYRRSRSACGAGEVWLDHRPQAPVPLSTVFQPKMPRRKSVTKLTDIKDITDKTSYCLTTQNQDSEGDVETRLYKGDVIPTSGGGAQVMFNDVEVLKQISPNTPVPSKRQSRRRSLAGQLETNCAVAIEGHARRGRV